MVNKKAFPKVAKAIRFSKEELEFLATIDANLTKAIQHCLRVAAAKEITAAVGNGGEGMKDGDQF
jgi:hypothetical protein